MDLGLTVILGRSSRVATTALLAVLVVAPMAHGQATDPSVVRRAIGVDKVDAEGPATLEADSISYDADKQVVRASGNVQVFHGDRVLRADSIVYDAKADRIDAEGHIRLVNPDGSVIEADDASFDSKIKDGLIRGARAVLADGQARIAAIEGRRVDGKFTTLSKAVFSPCAVCADDPTPLWRIRARKIIQDQEAHDIVYEDATFEFMGVPVGFLPYFRHADPSVRRRTGFLTPEFVSSTTLGDFLKTPFYWDIDGHRDMTITPFVGGGEVFPSGELEYRAILSDTSRYTLAGSLAFGEDARFLDHGGFRGHFDGDGQFDLGSGIEVGFDALVASDDTYLRRYEFSNIDRTTSRAYAQQFSDDGFASIEAVYYQSFRTGEPTGEIPKVLPHAAFEEIFDAPWMPGDIALTGDVLYLERSGTANRDTARISSTLSWRGNYVTQQGVVFDATASVRGDLYHVQNDTALDEGFEGRVLPLAALTTSLPMARQTGSGVHVIEPVVALVYAPYGGNPDNIPNEDSQDSELDELSIFELNRFPGIDRWESGPRATVGVRYSYLGSAGAAVRAELGQSYRFRQNPDFTTSSGLEDLSSDVVGAWSVSLDNFSIGHRFRLTDNLDFGRNEVYGTADLFDRFHFDGAYVALEADPAAGFAQDREEARASAALDLTQYWTLTGDARRDLVEERFVSAGAGLRYSDECFEIGFSMNRRFNSVEDAPSATTYNLAVRLKTIGVD